jgi:thioredoxin reductase (NADPH)
MDESVRQLHTLADSGAITLVTPFQLERLEGADGVLEAVIVADLDGGERRLEADVLLPFYGLEQSLGPISDWGLNADSNGIPVEPQTARTARAGIYAILTGFAEAAAAAHHAHGVVFPDKALHFEYSTTKGLPTRP